MTTSTTEAAPERRPAPDYPSCDIVMKGGITSGVLYPSVLYTIGSTYRIRGIGGASAGAIGAALGAAAEFARSSGGFERLLALPHQLGEGSLARLFQPEPATRQLLPLMLAASGGDRTGPSRSGATRAAAVLAALLRVFPAAAVIGVLPGIALTIIGLVSGGLAGWLLAMSGIVLSGSGGCAVILVRLTRKFTVDVPGNLFGICRGLGRDADHPGFTDWLCNQIDDIAGLSPQASPLTFGQLWEGNGDYEPDSEGDRCVDLRMITTCLSEGRPYELPWEARRFFFDAAEWRTLFPERVVAALETAPPPEPPDPNDADDWRWEEQVAARHEPPLCRLPSAEHLPVVVATRLSLSFPLLIAAVPLWTIDRHDRSTRDTVTQYRAAVAAGSAPPESGLKFARLWFTDGGFCSNFPVHLFDAALPSRPTFAINLGRFPSDQEPVADERKNVEWAKSNRAGLLPSIVDIPTRGFGAPAAFASAAINTSRNWQDNSHLDHPGYRDRIVRILQTKSEGGINLHMDSGTITRLIERGSVAAQVIVEQFNEPHYPEQAPIATGWDNHRWVRYRAFLSVLPGWLASYERGRAALDLDPSAPPSYELTLGEREFAARLTGELDTVARIASSADGAVVHGLTSKPRPTGSLRRIPRV